MFVNPCQWIWGIAQYLPVLRIMNVTVVLGASPKPGRYSHLAVQSLLKHGFEVVPVGIHEGQIDGLNVRTDRPAIGNVHTVSLYIHPRYQALWKDYILSLHPLRVIFNPGAENPELENELNLAGIATEHSCTLVLLNTGQFQSPEFS